MLIAASCLDRVKSCAAEDSDFMIIRQRYRCTPLSCRARRFLVRKLKGTQWRCRRPCSPTGRDSKTLAARRTTGIEFLAPAHQHGRHTSTRGKRELQGKLAGRGRPPRSWWWCLPAWSGGCAVSDKESGVMKRTHRERVQHGRAQGPGRRASLTGAQSGLDKAELHAVDGSAKLSQGRYRVLTVCCGPRTLESPPRASNPCRGLAHHLASQAHVHFNLTQATRACGP